MPVTETHTILEPLGATHLSDCVGQRVRIAFSGTDGDHSWKGTESGLYLGIVRSDHDGKPMHLFVDGEIRGIPQTSFGFPADVAMSAESVALLTGSTDRVRGYWDAGDAAAVATPSGERSVTVQFTITLKASDTRNAHAIAENLEDALAVGLEGAPASVGFEFSDVHVAFADDTEAG